MNCELCNDKIVIVPPPTVCFSCASTLQNLRATIDRLRAEFAQAEKDYIELTGAYENASVEAERLRAENAELKSENIKLETRAQNAENDLWNTRVDNAVLREQLMNNSPSTASDGGKQPD